MGLTQDGWGITHTGGKDSDLVISDGTATLTVVEHETLDKMSSMQVCLSPPNPTQPHPTSYHPHNHHQGGVIATLTVVDHETYDRMSSTPSLPPYPPPLPGVMWVFRLGILDVEVPFDMVNWMR